MDFQKIIMSTDFTDPEDVKTAFSKLALQVAVQDAKLAKLENGQLDLTNEVTDLKSRMSKAERYSSKTCLTFYNMKLVTQSSTPEIAILKVLNETLRIPISLSDLAACHFLPANGPVKPIIVKFIYHHHRDLAWNRRQMLSNFFTNKHLFKWPVYVKERLPELDRAIEREAFLKGLKPVTKNCQVFVNGNIPVNSIQELEDFVVASSVIEDRGVPPGTEDLQKTQTASAIINLATPALSSRHSKLAPKRLYSAIKSPANDPAIQHITAEIVDLNDRVESLVDNLAKIVSPVNKLQKADEQVVANIVTNIYTLE